MIDMLKGYLQLAGGVTQLTRQRALEVAQQLVAAMPPTGSVATGVNPEELAARASALADELLTAGRQNRALLMQIVRAEVENVVGRLGLTGRADLEAALATSRARIAALEHELAQRDAELSASRPAKRATAKRATAKRATAKKATAKKATAKKATAKKATAKKATAKKATAKKATAKKATTKKATTKRATAKKATARTAGTRA